MNKGTEVIQRFNQLIEQQEATAPQTHFAQSYVWLGDQYQNARRADYPIKSGSAARRLSYVCLAGQKLL